MLEGKIVLEYAGNIGRVQSLDKVMDMLPDNVELHLYGTGAMEEKLKASTARECVLSMGLTSVHNRTKCWQLATLL